MVVGAQPGGHFPPLRAARVHPAGNSGEAGHPAGGKSGKKPDGKSQQPPVLNVATRLARFRYREQTGRHQRTGGKRAAHRAAHDVVGHVRRLPDGWRTPARRVEEVRAAAEACGIMLPAGYTFVPAHRRGEGATFKGAPRKVSGLQSLELLNVRMPYEDIAERPAASRSQAADE